MRSDVQKQLVHYVQIYAVKDRVDFSHLSEAYPAPKRLDQISLDSVLPSADYKELMSNFVSRIMTKHLDFFFSDSVCAHIPHKYQKEMATRSEIVSACNLHLYACTCVFNLRSKYTHQPAHTCTQLFTAAH